MSNKADWKSVRKMVKNEVSKGGRMVQEEKKTQIDIFTSELYLKTGSFTHISPWQIPSDEECKSERSDIALSLTQPEKYPFRKKNYKDKGQNKP